MLHFTLNYRMTPNLKCYVSGLRVQHWICVQSTLGLWPKLLLVQWFLCKKFKSKLPTVYIQKSDNTRFPLVLETNVRCTLPLSVIIPSLQVMESSTLCRPLHLRNGALQLTRQAGTRIKRTLFGWVCCIYTIQVYLKCC